MTHTDNFSKAIAFGKWPIFKMVSFLQYLVFFLAVFCGRFFYLGYRFVFSGDWQKVMELIFLVLENAVKRIVNC